jgi:type II secretory pathway component PulL
MVANVVIEVSIGSIPILGDMFDIAWRANRRNYALLTGSIYEPRKYTIQSWFFLAALCLVLAALIIVPMILVTWMAAYIMRSLFGTDLHFHTWL